MTTKNTAEFERFRARMQTTLKRFTGEALVRRQKKIGLIALTKLVKTTPHDRGEARGGWNVGLNSPVIGAPTRFDKNGTDTIALGIGKMAALQPFQPIYISNSTPHIFVLEHGGFIPPNPGPSKDPRPHRKGRILVQDGYSTQAPAGMVTITVDSIVGEFG